VVSGRWTLADDTGLEVDALNGEPGVLSARYAGTERDYAANNKKLLEKLSDVAADKRTARFRCVMALVSPDGKTVIKEEGKLEGFIIASERGTNGFGYDPLFTPVNSGSTLAQLSAEEKNGLSHRFNAVRAMVPHIKRLAAG
jgi:XTP/dITP diphosphohydrolase